MQPVAQDLKFIETACQSLNDYLLSDLLYWPMDDQPASGGISASRATLGLLYLVVEHIRSRTLNTDQAEKLALAQVEIEKVHRKWKVAWEKKVAAEFKTRLKAWRNFLTEVRSDGKELTARYRTEVRNRVILQLLLLDLAADETGQVLALYNVDELLKSKLEEGVFVWDADLQPVFPEEKFWFLYRNLNI
ncbi:MAG: hypothetical protein AB9891_21690 [Anaerolineaceae bacterium]